MQPSELTALAWAIGGYLALQVALNLWAMGQVARAENKPRTIVVSAFRATVINAAYFLLAAILLREATPPEGNLPLLALLGVPLGIALWFGTTWARKAGESTYGRGEIVLAEEAIIRTPPNRRLLFWGMLNVSLLQPMARELFLRGLMLPVVARNLGWGWAIGSVLIVELLLRLNVAWLLQTVVYAAVMIGAFAITGNALLGLSAAVTAGFIQMLVLVRIGLRRSREVHEAREAEAARLARMNQPD